MSKKRQTLRGKVQKIIRPRHPSEPERAQIDVQEAEDLYREIRVRNELTDGDGEKAALKEGAEVDVIVEADTNATVKKPNQP